MSIFDFDENTTEKIGTVESVDTANVVIKVDNEDMLKQMQVNHLIVIQSSNVGKHLIALVTKIMRNSRMDAVDTENEPAFTIENVVKATLIGTHVDKVGTKTNVFKRTLETVPEISAECYKLDGQRLTNFMKAISQLAIDTKNPLTLGNYTLDDKAEAWLDGNKFFQRHAVIVGSTGSGKSWTVAKILEQVAKLSSANAIVFDIHGEYAPLKEKGFQHISDNNAPNQAMAFSNAVIEQKKKQLEVLDKKDILANFTIDSPVPYKIKDILDDFKAKDIETVTGSSGRSKQGPLHGKLTRFIQRLESKTNDKRLNFLFNTNETVLNYDYVEIISKKLMHSSSLQKEKGIKIIDFSEVPSDVLPLMVSLVGRIIFSIQQWISKDDRHPIALFCDEAHLYLPAKTNNSIEAAGLENF
jgi:hypothetical protein